MLELFNNNNNDNNSDNNNDNISNSKILIKREPLTYARTRRAVQKNNKYHLS